MVKAKEYQIDGFVYKVLIEKKLIRRIYVSIPNEDGTVKVKAPRFVSEKTIDKAVYELLPRLIKRKAKYDKRNAISPFGNDFTYVLGIKQNIVFKDEKEFSKYVKKNIAPQIEERFRYFESLMGIKNPYKLLLRDMSTRYGTNSLKTRRITLATSLAHYPMRVIDAIIVHELAHEYQRNHSNKFYSIVYKYCPDYKLLHAKLTNKSYEDDNI